MADLRANFFNRTRRLHIIIVFYEKTGKCREESSISINEFLNANTIFTGIVDTEDTNINTVWVGTTKLIHDVDMYFSAVLSEGVGYDGKNTSQVTITISSNPNVMKPPFSYIAI